MRRNRFPTVTAYVLTWVLLFPTLAFGQSPTRINSEQSKGIARSGVVPTSAFVIQVTGSIGNDAFERESARIAGLLSAKSAKSVVLIDEYGAAREPILQSVAE